MTPNKPFFAARLLILTVLAIQSATNAHLAVADDAAAHFSTYAGSLIQPGEGDGEILRRFEVRLLSRGSESFFHVIDDLRTGCPWPESFGDAGPAIPPEKVQPHLVYSYDSNVYVLGLPPLLVNLPQGIEPESTWEQAGWQMTAIEKRSVNKTDAWLIEARERRGRRQTLTVEASTGQILRAEADIFMGQGDQFQLTMARSSVKPLDADTTTRLADLQKELISLQSVLKRRPDAHLAELSDRQVKDVSSVVEQLTKLSTNTPLEDLVNQIRTNSEQQQKRLAAVASRATEMANAAAPQFSLSLVTGGKLDSATLHGKTVVLHFWDYRDAPLSEPYGQTGYLEFLFNQKKKMNVEVVGISTNPDFQTTENAGRGRRSARKLSEFMNLSYPIGHDDGSLLESLGDPRDVKGQLPLWIVLSVDGKVVHYHAGFYEVDAAQGLKELEAVLTEQIRRK